MTLQIGLRIDVDTWRGTGKGVPQLLRVLDKHAVRGTFFFSAGPDNMGRHLWRLLRPQFLIKMLRTNAPSLYGWDILLRGTLWPGPLIGKGHAPIIRDTARGGHEIGVHAWDHQAWQARVDKVGLAGVRSWMQQAMDALTGAAGQTPTCAATPGWRCTDDVLRNREEYPFHFNSDCRGVAVFRPAVAGAPLTQLQIPSTLPTYDELIGQNGITAENYNAHLIGLLRPGALNVVTIHAEAEGIVCADLFERFVEQVRAAGGELLPLGTLVEQAKAQGATPVCPVLREEIPGREGWVAVQGSALD